MSGKRTSRPPGLVRRVEREIRDGGLISPGTAVLVAVSGGPDSMALLHTLSALRKKLHFQAYAYAIDHGLRDDAPGEIALARQLAEDLEVPFGTTRLCVEAGGNLQARARRARLKALRTEAARIGAVGIALGHHADDRAETVIMRLLRGSGPAGLAVMPPHSGDLIRPLISARRADVIRHLRHHGVSFAEDPSNRDRRFLRVRVRYEVLPLLETISPRIVEHLCDLSEDLDALGLPAAPIGRQQLRQLAQAANLGNRDVRVSLPAGKVARIDFGSRRIVVEPGGTKGARKPRHRSDDA